MSLDVFQQVFKLSLVSGIIGLANGTQQDLQEWFQIIVSAALPGVSTDWQLAWGPVVWKNDPNDATTGPDNSWYIVFNPRLTFEDGSVHPTYVIAIAGSTQSSGYDWIEENFAVNTACNFNDWVAGGIQNQPANLPPWGVLPDQPHVSTGTVTGLHVLLTNQAPEGAASAGKTLLEFVADIDPSDSPRVITTGHSLGGALSPTLALALVSAGVIPADHTLTYPTAGPSPGDVDFANLFSRTFPARKADGAKSYQGWNLNLANTLDIVPQAWCHQVRISPEQNMSNIPSLYGLPAPPDVYIMTVLFAHLSCGSGALYAPLPSQYFTGSLSYDTPSNIQEFLDIVGSQHGRAYYDEIGVGLMFDLPDNAKLGRKSKYEIRYNYPVIAGFEWAYEYPDEAKKAVKEVLGTPEGDKLVIVKA